MEIDLHYYTFNIGDYRRDTFHLTLLEHGVYRQLIDTYYLNERPLCPDTAVVMRTHNARTKDEKAAVLAVLENFFFLTPEGWIHKGCEKTIDKYREKSAKARVSAESRWCKRNANASETQSEGNANHKPITNNHKPIKKNTSATVVAAPDGVSIETWEAFLTLRRAKKAPVTQRALDGIMAEAQKAGWSLDAAMTEMAARGWTGFKASWVVEKQTESERAREQMHKLTRGLATPKENKPFWAKSEPVEAIPNVEPKRLL
jgi:uncharacterized protein YdaU (DUF1376 family)